PYMERYYRDSYTHYMASGVQAEWRRILGQRWQVGGSLDARRYHHKEQALRIASDYSQFQAGLSLSFMPDNATSIYGGLDLTRKRYDIP
ncbi:surface lipoprotein assembly modifier, partial [Escherichia marmotae]|uniref:surface lipoprotein assembly modifier n=1 Tax=Escherichia marmotae TaxID=1499973 RepID=UPI00215A79F8